MDIATEVYVIDKGQITLHKKPEELKSDDEPLKRVLGACFTVDTKPIVISSW